MKRSRLEVFELGSEPVGLKERAPYRVEVVDGALKVPHEAVHVSDGRVGGGVLRNQHQGLAVVLQSLVVLSTETKHRHGIRLYPRIQQNDARTNVTNVCTGGDILKCF